MAPKRSRSKNLSVLPGMSLSLEERRALKGLVPAAVVNGSPAVAASASLSAAPPVAGRPSIPLRNLGAPAHTPPLPLRSDMPTIKNARRGGVATALDAGRSVGMLSLIDDLQQDREAASGKGVRASHLATWTTFHHRALGEDREDADRTPVLPLTPDKVVAVAALFKAGDYSSYANYLQDKICCPPLGRIYFTLLRRSPAHFPSTRTGQECDFHERL